MLGLFNGYQGPARRFAESTSSLIGPITLEAKRAGERSAGKPPAALDKAGAGTVTMAAGLKASAKATDEGEWKQSYGELPRAPPDERGGNRQTQPFCENFVGPNSNVG